MNRRVILMSMALLAVAGLFAWMLRAHWIQADAHQRATMAGKAHPRALLAPPPIDPPRPVMASEYLDVAQHTLFSRDRNPDVIVDVKPPPPKPPVPPLPSYYGQVALGEPGIFLSTATSGEKLYHAGDQVGDKEKFVIVSFDLDKIKLTFNDETLEKKLQDLRPKQPEPQQQAAAPAPQQPAGSRTGSLSASPAATEKADPTIGADLGAGNHACVAGDDSPAGTIKDGYRKVTPVTMFGKSCLWEAVSK